MKLAFRWRIALTFTALAALVFALLGGYLHSAVLRHSVHDIREALLAQARLAADALPSPPLRPGAELQSLLAEMDARSRARITLIDPHGKVVADSRHDPATMANHADRPERHQALTAGWGSAEHYSKTLGVRMLYVAIPLSDQGLPSYVLRLAMPLTAVEAETLELRRTLVVAFLISTAAVWLVSLWLAGSLSAPIQRLAHVARRLERGDLEARIPDLRVGELAEATQVFNSALARLAELVAFSQKESRYYSAILEQMSDGVVVVDGQGRVEFVNQAFRRIFGIDLEEVPGRYLEQLAPNFDLGLLLSRALEQGAAQSDDIELNHPDRRLLTAVATPLLDADGCVLGAVGLVHDITGLRRADEVRRDFVANASHELRTPAAAVKALAEALQAGALRDPDRGPDFVRQIVQASDRLTELLDDMLTLTRVERGRELLNPQDLSVAEAFAEAAGHAVPAAEAKGVLLRTQAAEEARLWADPQALQTVLINLLDNAIKYTPAGGQVTLKGQAVPEGCEISVTDTGIGIPPEHIPRIFERFYRVDKARDRAAGGTGLGLAIVRHIAEAHGGRVTARSAPGTGSTFSVIFPAPA